MDSSPGTSYYVNLEGQRLRKVGTTGTTIFAPDRGGPMMAEDANGIWVDYVWLNGRLIGRVSGGQLFAIHTDQVGRPESVTSASRSIAWSANNFAFDRQVVTEGFKLNLGFPGQYFDDEAKTWNNGFRDYRADLGRYVESDPIGLGAGPNTYSYVDSNPLIRTDIFGLDWVYHQRTGLLEHVDEHGNVRSVGTGYAGHGDGVNNPAMQNVPDSGPVPRGQYTIGQQQDNRTGSGHQLAGSMRLNPATSNPMQGRAGFLIHGPHSNDQMDSSNGCPIFTREIRNQIGQGVINGDNQLRAIE